jgi:hypothetical protein
MTNAEHQPKLDVAGNNVNWRFHSNARNCTHIPGITLFDAYLLMTPRNVGDAASSSRAAVGDRQFVCLQVCHSQLEVADVQADAAAAAEHCGGYFCPRCRRI